MYQSLVYDFLHASTATLEVWRSAKILTLETQHLPFDRVLYSRAAMPKELTSGAKPVVKSRHNALLSVTQYNNESSKN